MIQGRPTDHEIHRSRRTEAAGVKLGLAWLAVSGWMPQASRPHRQPSPIGEGRPTHMRSHKPLPSKTPRPSALSRRSEELLAYPAHNACASAGPSSPASRHLQGRAAWSGSGSLNRRKKKKKKMNEERSRGWRRGECVGHRRAAGLPGHPRCRPCIGIGEDDLPAGLRPRARQFGGHASTVG